MKVMYFSDFEFWILEYWSFDLILNLGFYISYLLSSAFCVLK